MITSRGNPAVKRVKRLQAERRAREREGVFVVEGSRWLADLLLVGRQPEKVLCTEGWLAGEGSSELLRQLHAPARLVSDALMAEMSLLEQSPGVLAVVAQPSLPLPAEPTLLLILDNVRVPGNLGTIARTAAAAGVDGLLLTPGCVEFYNPKVVRSAMGAHLRLPVRTVTWGEIQTLCAGMAIWLAAGGGERLYTEVDWLRPTALVIGSEAAGAGEAAAEIADGRIAIPMAAETESLNAAMAAGIILFEAVRRRRAWAGGTNQSEPVTG